MTTNREIVSPVMRKLSAYVAGASRKALPGKIMERVTDVPQLRPLLQA